MLLGEQEREEKGGSSFFDLQKIEQQKAAAAAAAAGSLQALQAPRGPSGVKAQDGDHSCPVCGEDFERMWWEPPGAPRAVR